MSDGRDLQPNRPAGGGANNGSGRGFTFGSTGGPQDRPQDRMTDPQLTDGTIARRIFAYLIDVLILGAIAFAIHLVVFATLGLLAPLLYPLLVVMPLIYHTYFVGSEGAATLGQRLLGLEVRALDGARPPYLQAFIMVCLFYLTLALTTGLLLLWCLIDDRGRCLHDILSGTLVIRTDRLAERMGADT